MLIVNCYFLESFKSYNDFLDFNLIEQCKKKSDNPNIEYHFWMKRYEAIFGVGEYFEGGYVYRDTGMYLVLKLDETTDTVQKVIDAENAYLSTIKSASKRAIETFVTYLGAYSVCFDWDDENVKIMNETKLNLYALYELLWENDAKRFRDFKAFGGVECYDRLTKLEVFRQCFETVPKLFSFLRMPAFQASPNVTDSVEAFKVCIIDALEECQNSEITELFETIFPYITADMLVEITSAGRYMPGLRQVGYERSAYIASHLKLYRKIQDLYGNNVRGSSNVNKGMMEVIGTMITAHEANLVMLKAHQ